MNLDRWIALLFLIISLIYGLAAFNYPLLPFERNMAFLPNTLPIALSVLGGAVALFILFLPKTETGEESVTTINDLKQFKFGQALGLVFAMILYAILLRPIGFILATTLFITGASFLLGERKIHYLIPIAVIAAFLVWYLVQQTLGIFLRPWPIAFSG